MDEEETAAASVDERSERSIFPSAIKEVPWLVIPYGEKSGTPRKQGFYDICGGNTCRKSIPQLIGNLYWQKPSHQGWLIVICHYRKYDYEFGDCFLLNPSTLENIPLPSLSNWFDKASGYSFVDCVLSSPPNSDDDSLVLFVFSDDPEGNCNLVFLYCRPGDKNWRRQYWYSGTIQVVDMVSLHYFNRKFYLMCISEHQLEISIRREFDDLLFRTIKVSGMGSYPSVGGDNTCSPFHHFVETDNQLYCIPFTYTQRGFLKEVIQIVVLKLDFYEMAWKMVYSIGDHVLFLGSSSRTTACSSAVKMGLASGCVYFTLPDDHSLYRFDVASTGNSVIVPRSSLPKPWEYSDFIMIPTGGKRKSEKQVGGTDEHENNSITPDVRTGTYLYPLLIFSRDHDCTTFNTVNPMHNGEKYFLELPDLGKTVIRFQKGGWLLLSMEPCSFCFFFYNPFTRETIKLPELPSEYMFSSTTFSSLPTSSDCVVFAIGKGMYNEICVYYIRKGDVSWSYCRFTNGDKYMPSYNTPVFRDGSFYYVDYNGSLGVFNIKKNSWKVLEKPSQPFCGIYPSFLVECGGEFLLVKLGRLGTFFGVFRLDFSLMDWVKIENLGTHVLFVSYTSCFSAIAPPNSRMENKVYFPRLCMNGEGVLFYCLETGSYGSFGDRHSASDFTYTEGWYSNCTWIQPNPSKSTAQELQWDYAS